MQRIGEWQWQMRVACGPGDDALGRSRLAGDHQVVAAEVERFQGIPKKRGVRSDDSARRA
jgi:hypothetical protein